MKKEIKNRSLVSSVIIGGVTGGIEAFIINPLVTIKACLQKGIVIPWGKYFPKQLNCSQKINGSLKFIKFLYRGTIAHVLGMSAVIATRMSVHDVVIKYGFKTSCPTIQEGVSAAYIGGIVSALWAAPMELGMTLQQTTDHNLKVPNFIDTYKKVISDWGWKKGVTGVTCVGIREGVVTMGFLTFTPQFKKHLNEKYKINDIISSIVAGGSIGAACATVTHPFDTIKTIQQTNLRDSNFRKASSLPYVIKQIFIEDGIKGFYKGLFFRTMRVAPHVTIASFISEKLINAWDSDKINERVCK